MTARPQVLPSGGQAGRLERAVAGVLPAYGLPLDTPFELMSISENATFRVHDPDRGAAILRVHRSGYLRRQEILSELIWLDALRAAGMRTPVAISTTGGDRIATTYDAPLADERHFVLFEELPGTEVDAAGWVEWAERVGQLSAQMQDVAMSWTPPPAFSRPAWDAETLVGDVARWGGWRSAPYLDAERLCLLARAEAAIRSRLADADSGAAGLRRVLVHADLRPANLLDDGADVAIIDFDDMSWSWQAWDLVGYLRGREGDSRAAVVIERWLEGYRRVLPLSRTAEDLIPTFLLASRLQGLGWLGTHSHTRLAQRGGAGYVAATCELADVYLGRGSWL